MISGLVLALHIKLYQSFFTDDALISLRYADRFLQGKGLTWTDGEYVEGYSNLLWVLLVSLGGLLGFDLVSVARTLGITCMFASLVMIFCFAKNLKGREGDSLRVDGLTGVLFASSGIVAAWSVGGLEQPLLLLLLLIAVFLLFQGCHCEEANPHTESGHLDTEKIQSDSSKFLIFTTASALCFSLLTLARSDGILFAAATWPILLWEVHQKRLSWKILLLLILVPCSFLLGQTLWRFWYYGEWVSNIAKVKVAFTLHHLQYGLRYIARGIMVNGVLLGFAVWGAIASWKTHRSPILIISSITIVWLCYLICIGGDVNPPSRHFIPIVGLASIAVLFIPTLKKLSKSFVVVLLLFHLLIQTFDAESRDARGSYSQGVWRGKYVGEYLRVQYGDANVKIAVDAAGAVPFWSKLPALDMLGLNDAYLADHKPASFGATWIGHELGDGEYVLGRKPDIVIFGHPYGSEPGFLSGKQLMENLRFHQEYEERKILLKGDEKTGSDFIFTGWFKKSYS